MRPLLAAFAIVVASLPFCPSAGAQGAEAIVVTEDSGAAGLDMGSAAGCGCRNVQRPPWHGNVRGPTCSPACGTGGKFHANPCAQLHLRRHARENCMTLPPCFPRLHAWHAEGVMPTPQPPAMPRCHQCGAAIEGGF